MAFWDLLTVACMPIVNVLFISGLGAGLSTQYAGVLTEEIRRSLNKVVFTVFTPALMFASLAQSVTFDDLISWRSMPFNVFLTFFIGAILGWIIVKITKPPEYLNGIVVANCCGGNMGNLLIVVVPALCHERESPFGEPGICKLNGTAYVSLSMAIGSIFTWTYTYNLIRSASLINEMKELENGLHENIPNINYLNAGETSKLLQRIVIIPAVPSSGGDYPSDKPKANGMTCDLLFFLGNNPQRKSQSVDSLSSTLTRARWMVLSGKRSFKPSFYSLSTKQMFSKEGGSRIQCAGKSITIPSESEENPANVWFYSMEKEDPVAQFKMSDFELCNHVSIGLSGRKDEVVLEAIVRNSESPLKNSRVVLRQLTGSHAQSRGRRALEVLRKLARRQFMYRSYATRVHRYILPSGAMDQCSFTLVHGTGFQRWKLKLALDEDCARRVGDDTTGGPAASRQSRLIRMLMRDLLIGVNYLHSHGLAHTELRLENVHISCVDRHVKVISSYAVTPMRPLPTKLHSNVDQFYFEFWVAKHKKK